MYVMPFEKESYVELPKLYVLCQVSDISNLYFKQLTESSVKYGLVITPFSSDPQRFIVNFIKDKLATDIILYIDGYNTLFNGDKTQIITQYRWFQEQYGDKAVFSAEKTCCIKGYTPDQFPKTPFEYRYLHSEAFISSVSALRRILNSDEFNPQFFTRLYLDARILLDTHNLIFNKVYTDDVEQHGKAWFNKITKSYPLILITDQHSKTFLFEILNK
jgi:hypothetical protein